MDHILCQMFKITLSYIIEKHQKVTANPPVRIYLNKMENRITFRIKMGYYLVLLMSETMKLLKSIKNKITKDENGRNLPCFLISIELLLIHTHQNLLEMPHPLF